MGERKFRANEAVIVMVEGDVLKTCKVDAKDLEAGKKIKLDGKWYDVTKISKSECGKCINVFVKLIPPKKRPEKTGGPRPGKGSSKQ